MSRITFVHWNAGEAKERAARLRSAGHAVSLLRTDRGEEGLRAARQAPPDLFVIDLERLPSQGRAVAAWFRQQKATRKIPILFVGGEREKVDAVRRHLPDAVYTQWRRIRGDLRRAARAKPEDPVVPEGIAGYSGTPLPRKLGIRAGARVILMDAPRDFERAIGKLPEGAILRRHARGRASTILLFVRSLAALRRKFTVADRALEAGGGLWIIWPKKASGVLTDLTQPEVRGFGLRSGYVDYKICAVDRTWSGLLFARRRGGAKARRS